MAEKHQIPQTADELTPTWFSATLGSKYGRSITAVDTEVIGEGIGFIGELHRCTLTWGDDPRSESASGSSQSPPASVVVKLPAPTGVNRSSGEALLAYDREIFIYKHLHDQMGIPMPEYYWSDQDKLTTLWAFKPLMFLIDHLPVRAVNWLVLRFVKLSGKNQRRYLLMMEDIADARPPSQVEGGTLDDALAALDVLAKFHAHHWEHARDDGESLSTMLDEAPLIFPIDQGPKTWQAGYLRNREVFIEQFGDAIGAKTLAKLDRAQDDLIDLIKSLGAAPRTLLHADYRLDNILYRPNGELVVLDYQLVSTGRAGWDVGYFITTALTPDLKNEEEALLRRYHDSLVAAGVANYSWEMLADDIATTKLVLAHRMVGARDLLDSDMEGSADSFADILVERIVGWID